MTLKVRSPHCQRQRNDNDYYPTIRHYKLPMPSKPRLALSAFPFSRAILFASFTLTFGAAAAAPPPVPQHSFMEVSISPDARNVASVEGDAANSGAPVVRDLVIRSADGETMTTVALPCGRVNQCWPSSPAWTPDSRKITFALRKPGSHARAIYQVNADGSNLTLLLAFDGIVDTLKYGPRGQLAMLATAGATKEAGATEAGAPLTGDLDEAPPEQRIAILEKGTLRWISPASLFVYEYDWRPDGEGFVGTAAPGDGDKNWWVAKLYAFDRAEARVLYAPASPQQQLAMPKISRNGKRVAFIAGIMSDFGATGGDIYTLPLTGGSAVNLTPQLPASAISLAWSCDGHLVAGVLAEDQTQLVDFGNGIQPRHGKIMWQGQESFSDDQPLLNNACPTDTAAMVHESFNHPPEIEIGTTGHWHDLTHINKTLTAPFKVQSVNWNSDEFKVQGWLILPTVAPAGGKSPLITIVHGGPASAVQPRFIGAGKNRTLLEHGYALFLPNPRGSFGQGEAFTAANVRDFGYGDLRDILNGLDAVTAIAPIDPEKIGITGHSYGGYMTMWAVTQSNRFKAAVADAGISNWQSYYGENGIDEWLIPYFGTSVYQDPAIYAKSSPLTFIRQIHTPTLSIVGDADIECPAPQTQEFGHALKALGIPSATIIYPDEGHHFHDPVHLADRDKRTLEWFDRYLR